LKNINAEYYRYYYIDNIIETINRMNNCTLFYPFLIESHQASAYFSKLEYFIENTAFLKPFKDEICFQQLKAQFTPYKSAGKFLEAFFLGSSEGMWQSIHKHLSALQEEIHSKIGISPLRINDLSILWDEQIRTLENFINIEATEYNSLREQQNNWSHLYSYFGHYIPLTPELNQILNSAIKHKKATLFMRNLIKQKFSKRI
jgi:hypothetical protein